jgi:hypothetical protein
VKTRIAASAVAAAALLLVALPWPAYAINTDPRCDDIGLPVNTSPDATADFPTEIQVGAADCVITVSGRSTLFFFHNPFERFLSTIDAFSSGWEATEVQGSGSRIRADLAALPARESDDRIQIGLLAGSGAYLDLFYWSDLQENVYGFTNLTGDVLAIMYSPPRSVPTGFGDPSILSSLKPAALPNPLQSAILMATAAALAALIGFPGLLLGSVISNRSEQFERWGRRLASRVPRISLRLPASVSIAVTVVAAAVLTGFLNPAFGFNGLSLRVVLTQAIAFAVFNVGAWLVLRALRGRLGLTLPALKVHPLSLVAIAAFVLLSRLLVIEPGIVFGLITAIVFAGALAQTQQVRVILVGAAYSAAVGLVSWVLFSVIPALGVREFFAGLTLEGVSTLPLALLPLALLDGAIVFRWNRIAWASVYVASIALFMLVVLHLPGDSLAVPQDFVRWILAFAGFAAVAVAVWSIDRAFTRAWAPDGSARRARP